MADFRMKLFTLAGAATVFAGMAFGQATCSTANSNPVFVRAEGNTEQVADVTLVCTVPAAGTAVTAGQTATIQIYLSPSVAITSANIGTSSAPVSEAVAGVSTGTAFTSPLVNGTVSGNSVTFASIILPATAPSGTFNLTVTNIKIQASSIAAGTGVPPSVTESIFVSGTGVTLSTTTATVAYVAPGLSVSKTTSPVTTNLLCAAVAASGNVNFTVSFSEAFPNSFKVKGPAAATIGAWYTSHTETGYPVTATNPNTATSGTRIQIVFSNIPNNVTVYVPTTLNGLVAENGAALNLTASATGAFSQVAASTATGAPAGAASLTATNGSATAVYEVSAISTAPGTFAIPVYLQSANGAVTAPTTPITGTVSFAPIGSTNVPNFVSGASTLTVSGSVYNACATTLLFPYVTNSSGFETGIAIANTGSDLLGTKNGSPVSSVTGQTGTCLLTFFGSATAAPYTTPSSVAPGTVWSGTLTSAAGVTGLTGYAIAQCNFLYAHGYAFVETGLGTTSGVAEGYLALVLNPTAARNTVSSTAPESLNN